MTRILYKVEIPKFKTHAAKSKKQNIKINGQAIYSGLHHTVKGKVINSMHEYLYQYIKPIENLVIEYPIIIRIHMYLPINYGDVKMIKSKLAWISPISDYKARWDLDNLTWVWNKVIQDVLQEQGIIKDDNIMYIRQVIYEYTPVNTIEDRKMVITLEESEPKWIQLWNQLFNNNN